MDASEPMTEAELAERSGAPQGMVRRLLDLGIVPERPGDHPFMPPDIQRVRLARALDESGIPLDAIGAAVASGHLSFGFVDALFPEPPAITGKTFRDVATELSIPLDTVLRLYAMWGLPRPSPQDEVREDDAETFGEWLALMPPGALNERVLVQGARLFGDATHRLADWAMDFYRTYMEEPAFASGASRPEAMDVASALAGAAQPLMERQLVWMLRRQLEHNTIQHLIEYVESAMEEAGLAPARQGKPPAIGFLDLTGYTSLTETFGDQAAADLAGRLGETVQDLSHRHGGHVVKLLGDGVMFHFADPGEAVVCGLELVDDAEKSGLPPARVGVAAGPVVERDGDFFGRTVNIAARVADHARPHEVLATPEAAAAGNPDLIRFDEIGPVALKGVAAPIVLSAASWAKR